MRIYPEILESNLESEGFGADVMECAIKWLLTVFSFLRNTNTMAEKFSLRQLESLLWETADILRDNMDSSEFKDYKSRWGSCSTTGDISYNWKIVMAPHRIVDYVVVHELCHLLEHNHSAIYWRHVERIIPDFKKCGEWLK